MKEGKHSTKFNSKQSIQEGNTKSNVFTIEGKVIKSASNGWVSDTFTFIANTIISNNARFADHGCLKKSITTPKAQNLH